MIALPNPSSRSTAARLGRATPALLALLLALGSLLAMRAAAVPQAPLAPVSVPTAADLSRQPLAFVPNAGQTDPLVRFQAQGMGGSIFFTPGEVVLVLPTAPDRAAGDSPLSLDALQRTPPQPRPTALVSLRFDGANLSAPVRADDKLPGVLNIIEGTDPSKWHTNLPSYGSITYQGIYDGIDLHYAGSDGRLKGTYRVLAGADPAQIRWRYPGSSGVQITGAGDLQIGLPSAQAPLFERSPIAWQEINGRNVPVGVRYQLRADGSVGFELGSYDAAYPLTIDPTLEYSTYLGGTGNDRFYAVAVDTATGDVFVAGETNSDDFPGSPTNVGNTGPGSFPNVLVTRIAANGSATVYRTIVGGINSDIAYGLAVSGGVANVVGQTFSPDLPPAGTAYQAAFGGSSDMFALALNGSGALSYSTYIGGVNNDIAYGVAAAGNNLFIAGSSDGVFPSASAPVGGFDAIVLNIDKTAGPVAQYVLRIGGLSNDIARAIVLDTVGNAYITGTTSSNSGSPPGFPTAGTPYQNTSGGGQDAFVSQIGAGGTLAYSTYLGGSQADQGLGIAVDPAGGVVYVTGSTLSPNFPAPASPSPGTPQAQDAFVTKLNISTNTLDYNRLLGSPGVDIANAIALDATGAAYVAGQTSSTNFFALNPLPEMANRGGNVDGFVTRYDPNGIPSYSTRLGGSLNDIATGVATIQTPQGAKVYVAGITNSGNFPQTNPPTGIQPTLGGSDDGFVVRISNTRPIVDLNDNNPGNGIDFGPTTWTEAAGALPNSAVPIVNPSGLTVIDTDNPTLAYARVRFVDPSGAADNVGIVPPDNGTEILFVSELGTTSRYNPATGTLVITGGATLADYQNTLRTLGYNNNTDNPTAGTRRVVVEISDGIDINQPFAISLINVVATNDPPVLTVPGPQSVLEEQPLTITGIRVDDVDALGDDVQVTLTVPAVAGTLSATPSGLANVTGNASVSLQVTGTITDVNATLASLTFTGATDFNTNSGGADTPTTLTVVANDLGNNPTPPQTDTETVAITVNPVNDAPVVPSTPPTVTTAEDTALTIRLTDLGVSDAKDTTSPPAAPGAAPFPPTGLILATTPANGTISGIDQSTGTLIYTPNPNYNGPDSFNIQVCDTGTPPPSLCSNLTVNVNVTAVNDAPVLTVPATVVASEELTQTVAVSVADVDAAGGSIQVSLSVPANTLALNATLSGTANVVGSGTANLQITGTITDVNATLATLTVRGVLDFNTNNGSGPDAPVTLTVAVNDNGNTGAGGALTDSKTAQITVNPVNDPPAYATSPVSVIADEDTTKVLSVTADLQANDNKDLLPPAAPGGVRFVPLQSISTASAPAFGTLGSFNQSAGTFTYTPNPNYYGPDSFQVQICDLGTPGSACSTQTVNVTVRPGNDPPTVTVPGAQTLLEDSYRAIPGITVADPDAAAGNIALGLRVPAVAGTLVVTPTTGAIVLTGNDTAVLTITGTITDVNSTVASLVFKGALHYNTTIPSGGLADTPFALTVTANDLGNTGTGNQLTDTKSIAVSITPVNDVPKFTPTLNGDNITVAEDSGQHVSLFATVSAGPTPDEVNTQQLQFNILSNSNPSLFAGAVQISASGTITFTPAPNATGVATIVVNLQDTGGTANGGVDTSPSYTFTITITAVNDPPTFTPGGNVSTNEDTPFSAPWASNITPGGGTDEISQTVTFNITVSNPALFTSGPTIDATGVLSFTPALNRYGVVTATVILSDNGNPAASTPPVTFLITINSVNDGPPVTQPDTATVAEDSTVPINVLANDADPADLPQGGIDPKTVLISSPPANGTVSVDPASGVITYTPNPNFNGTDVFSYTVADIDPGGVLRSTPTLVTITVTPVNDPPTAVPDVYSLPEDSVDFSMDVLANDSSAPDTGETLSISGFTQPSHGVISVVGGAILYTPDPNYNGPDAFTYTISDGNGGTATTSVALTVTPMNDPPVARPDFADVGLNTQRIINVLGNDSIEPDENELLTVTRIITPALHGSATVANGGTNVSYTPIANYVGPDSFVYEVCDDGVGGPPGPLCATAVVTLNVGNIRTFLPIVLHPKLPDLVVQMTVSTGVIIWQEPAEIQLVVTNQGTAPTTPFWVDLYLNPKTPPAEANIPWNETCTMDPCYGVAWFVEEPLQPGQSITLRTNAASYVRENSRWVGFLPRGTTDVYAYVDSWNRDPKGGAKVPWGADLEISESNNRAELHYVPTTAGAGEGRGAPAIDLQVLDRPYTLKLPERSLSPKR